MSKYSKSSKDYFDNFVDLNGLLLKLLQRFLNGPFMESLVYFCSFPTIYRIKTVVDSAGFELGTLEYEASTLTIGPPLPPPPRPLLKIVLEHKSRRGNFILFCCNKVTRLNRRQNCILDNTLDGWIQCDHMTR